MGVDDIRAEMVQCNIGKARILIVEDETFVALSMQSILSEAGYEVVGIVSTGEEAFALGVEHRPDLVLMDIRLAGQMTGVDAGIALSKEGVASLFASAHADKSTRSAAEEAHPVGWLAKPFPASELLSAVRSGLDRLSLARY